MYKVKFLSSMFMIAMFIGTMGCQQDDFGVNSSTTGGEINELSSDDFAVVGIEDEIANVEDVTLEKDFAMTPVFDNDGSASGRGSRRGGKFSRRDGHRGHKGSHLKQILHDLGVTDAQKTQIKEAIATHHETIAPVLDTLRVVNQSIIEAAKAQRQAIITSFRNGDITRDEARLQIQTLKETTQEAIRNNPDTADLRQQLCDSKLALFASIRALLDADQQVLWDEWVATLDGPCFGI